MTPPRPHADPAHLAVHVGDAAVALGGPVEFADLSHAEALGEGLPHAGAEPVPHRQPHAVPRLRRTHRLGQQVPAGLPNVLHHLRERVREEEGTGERRGEEGKRSQGVIRTTVPALAKNQLLLALSLITYCAVVLYAIFPEATG